MDGLDFAVKYPFTAEARQAIVNLDLNERIVELGVDRLLQAIKSQNISRIPVHESDKKEEVASFAAARMILGHLRNSYVTNTFAVNESKIVRSKLDREDEHTIDMVAMRFGIKTNKDGNTIIVDLPTYIKYSPRSPHYRLINRRIKAGNVEITPAEKKRMIEEAVKKHIEIIPLVKDPPDIIKKAAERIIEELPKTQTQITVTPGDYPPCIDRLLESVKKHENLPHHARWYFATYFLAIHMGEDELVMLFSNLPDYSEKITRYQISHAKKKGYSVPSCATVTGYGLCCADCRVGTPIRWHELNEQSKSRLKK